MKTILRQAFAALLPLAVIGCGGKLMVKVDIADPARVAAVRTSQSFRTQCYALATQTDAQIRAEVDPVIDQVTQAAQAFRDASMHYADAAKLGESAKRKIMGMPHARADIEATFDVDAHVRHLLNLRDTIAHAAEARGCENRNTAMEKLIAQRASLQSAFQKRLRDGLDGLKRVTDRILNTQPASAASVAAARGAKDTGSAQITQAFDATLTAISAITPTRTHCREAICGNNLVESADAYPVASLPESAWSARFNHAFAQGTNGNVDIVIKLDQQADFTVKGMRFDASKVAEVARKAVTQGLLLATQIAGVPPSTALSSGSTESKALYSASQGYGAVLQKQDKRDAIIAARRDALIGIAITIASSQKEMQDSNGRDQLKAAVTARTSGSDSLLRLTDYPTN